MAIAIPLITAPDAKAKAAASAKAQFAAMLQAGDLALLAITAGEATTL